MPGTAWALRGAALPLQPQAIPTTCSQVPMFSCRALRATDPQVPEGCCRQAAKALGFSLTPGILQGFAGTRHASLCNLRRGSWGTGRGVGGDVPKAVQKGPCPAQPVGG